MITRPFSNNFSEVYLPLRGVRAGLFSVRLWELPAWFDATAPPHLSGVRLCSLCPISLHPIYFSLAQRYAADLSPFLIFCLIIFLGQAA